MAVAALAVAAAVFAGFATSKGHAASEVKVAVVPDIGKINDRSFNFLANQGRLKAQSQLGVQTRIYTTNSAAERLTNLQAAAQSGYQLVIAVGFLQFDALGKVAPAFASTSFAGVDVPSALVKGTPKNVRGLDFKEQEAGYLVGYLAGLVVKQQGGKQVIGAVGANNVPAIVHYMAGYQAGAKKANPGIKVLLQFANDPTFSDQAKCKETASNEIAQGSQVIFQVAGGCGLGALDAAKQAKIWGIGVDADQFYLGPFMLTSAVKRVDVAVFQTIQEFQKSPTGFKGGFDKIFDVKSGGVGYGRVSSKVPKADIAKLNAIQKQIASGKIVPPTKF
jgi:basic membrane protein A and related proteins